MYKILQEKTVWNTDFRMPNHTYLFDPEGYVVAYIREGETEPYIKKGRNLLNKARRKFVPVHNEALAALIPSSPKSPPARTAGTRAFDVKSGNHTYRVEVDANENYSCSCIGYGYRRKCKHGEAVLAGLRK